MTLSSTSGGQVSSPQPVMRILLIDHDAFHAAVLCHYLEQCGHEVDYAGSDRHGLKLAADCRFDAIVLARSPGHDGAEVCRSLREVLRLTTPLLVLAQCAKLEPCLAALQSGADDYLYAPIEFPEVNARLVGMHRRYRRRQGGPVLRAGDLEYDLKSQEVRRQGRTLRLRPSSRRLLRALLEVAPEPAGYRELVRDLWGRELDHAQEALLRTHVCQLRNAIDRPFKMPMIRTFHGLGYGVVVAGEA
jgi:DNA-binding response OmpR family regulator